MKSVLLVYQDGRFLNLVNDLIKSIKNCKCKITTKERDNLSVNDYKNKDIIIIAGGDGTFLRASHFNKNLPMLGINPDPKRKEGFFMQTTINN